eukprot:248183-Chlamydomonas_euryale.AAC.6
MAGAQGEALGSSMNLLHHAGQTFAVAREGWIYGVASASRMQRAAKTCPHHKSKSTGANKVI